MADEQNRLHEDLTWAQYRALVENNQIREDYIYFITDMDFNEIVQELIDEVQALKNQVDEFIHGGNGAQG